MGKTASARRSLRVLVLEHVPEDAELVLWELNRAGLELQADVVATREDFLARVKERVYDVVLADYRLPNWSGLDALDLLRRHGKEIPFFLVTGTLGEEAAVECIKRGVTDYILKQNLARLPIAVERALEEKALREEHARAEQALRDSEAGFRLLFAHNPLPMWVFDLESVCFLQVNDAAVTHYGYSREEFLSRKITDLRPRGDGVRSFEEFAQQPGIERFTGRARHLLKDGRIIDVEMALRWLSFGGRPAALVVAQDVTERLRAEREIHLLQTLSLAIAEADDLTSALEVVLQRVCQETNWALGQAWMVSPDGSRLVCSPVFHCEALGLEDFRKLNENYTFEPGKGLPGSVWAAKKPVWIPDVTSDPGFPHTPAARQAGLKGGIGFPVMAGAEVVAVVEFFVREQRAEDDRLLQLISAVAAQLGTLIERKRAEAALRESEALYCTLFETAPDAIALFDADFRIVAVNHRAIELYGYESKEEVLGQISLQFLTPEDRPRAVENRKLLLHTGSYRDIEYTALKKDAAPFPIEFSISVLRDPEGRIHGMIGLSRDLTKRKHAEEALLRSESRYRSLVENSTYGIYRATPEGQFLDVNPALVRMLGYDSAAELLHPDLTREVFSDPAIRSQIVQQLRQAGRIESLETEWKRKDGAKITVRLSGRAVAGEQGGLEAIVMIAEDVTERLAMEKRLRQVQKFEAIGQLAGGIAHDFNNVIGAILGWAELGQDQAPPDSHLQGNFRHIREQAERAAGLTRQLLAFARRQILEPRPINLNQTITDFLSLLENVIGKHIEISTVLAPDLGVVHADPTQIEQVLMNLCLNARDAMPRGGRLVLQTQDVEIDAEFCQLHSYVQAGRYALLSVSDTGSGMDARIIEHIFEPFFTTKELGRGTGLGLATVYGVAKQHGGFVQVQSELGRGSTFQVYLPVGGGAPVLENHTDKADGERVQGGTETILVAEDHDGVREMARMTLENLGYHLLLATDGVEAVESFRAHKDTIALVLLDVVMPRLGGPDAYLKMCSLRPELPVLFTTGYSAETAFLGALLEKGGTVLQKPYSPTLLGRRVREVLDHAGAPSPVRLTKDRS